MKHLLVISGIALLGSAQLFSQVSAGAGAASSAARVALSAAASPGAEWGIVEPPGESKDDPGYALYKEGYNLILSENWDAAKKKFSDLLSRFPKSRYADDAWYWRAYAMKHTDKKAALEEYRKFINENPKSSYYDEAFNDYLELTGGSAKGLNNLTVKSGGRVYVDDNGVTIDKGRLHLNEGGAVVYSTAPAVPTPLTTAHPKIGSAYTLTVAPSVRLTEQKMRQAERQIARQMARLTSPTLARTPMASSHLLAEPEMYDEDTRLKMDALYALGETKEDSISYRTLREVAVDMKQPRVLRETAMDALSNFSRYDVLPVYLEIARRDTSEEVQNLAIDYMGQLSRSKNRSLETLIELFGAIPKSRVSQLQTVLGSIAEIGNDKAVDFLATVARTHEEYELRSDAVYYLGNIGGEKARAALYEILKGK